MFYEDSEFKCSFVRLRSMDMSRKNQAGDIVNKWLRVRIEKVDKYYRCSWGHARLDIYHKKIHRREKMRMPVMLSPLWKVELVHYVTYYGIPDYSCSCCEATHSTTLLTLRRSAL